MSPKVLIVDDSMTARKVISICLKNLGCEVIEATDGKDGLQKAQDNPEIDLIFSDINMPWMNGVEMVEAIKEIESLRPIPICMLTTESSTDAVAQVKALGVNAFLVKPIQPDQLKAVIDGYVKSAT